MLVFRIMARTVFLVGLEQESMKRWGKRSVLRENLNPLLVQCAMLIRIILANTRSILKIANGPYVGATDKRAP